MIRNTSNKEHARTKAYPLERQPYHTTFMMAWHHQMMVLLPSLSRRSKGGSAKDVTRLNFKTVHSSGSRASARMDAMQTTFTTNAL
jgi:hypothetical protein